MDPQEPNPPPSLPLLFLPLNIAGLSCPALLDSGASDNFISTNMVKHLHLVPKLLREPGTLTVANGAQLEITHFIRTHVSVGTLRTRLFFRITDTPLPVVLGLPFLKQYEPIIDWGNRIISITRQGISHAIQALPGEPRIEITLTLTPRSYSFNLQTHFPHFNR